MKLIKELRYEIAGLKLQMNKVCLWPAVFPRTLLIWTIYMKRYSRVKTIHFSVMTSLMLNKRVYDINVESMLIICFKCSLEWLECKEWAETQRKWKIDKTSDWHLGRKMDENKRNYESNFSYSRASFQCCWSWLQSF